MGHLHLLLGEMGLDEMGINRCFMTERWGL